MVMPEFKELPNKTSISLLTSSSVKPNMNLYSRSLGLQQSKHLRFTMSLVTLMNFMMSTAQRRIQVKPTKSISLKCWQKSDFQPPMMRRYSPGNLKGAPSKFMFPGELPSRNPKSMWMMWPSESSMMLPLCLSLIRNRYWRMQQPARLLVKLMAAVSSIELNRSWKTLERSTPLRFLSWLMVQVFGMNSMKPELAEVMMMSQVRTHNLRLNQAKIDFTILISCMAKASCRRSSPLFTTYALTYKLLKLLNLEDSLILQTIWSQLSSGAMLPIFVSSLDDWFLLVQSFFLSFLSSMKTDILIAKSLSYVCRSQRRSWMSSLLSDSDPCDTSLVDPEPFSDCSYCVNSSKLHHIRLTLQFQKPVDREPSPWWRSKYTPPG